MRSKALSLAIILIGLCAAPAMAQEDWREWDPAAMQWVSLGLGIAAGIAVDWGVWGFSFGDSLETEEVTPFRRLALHKLPTAVVGMATSVVIMNAYFRLTTYETDQLGGYLLKGTLLGAAGGALAVTTSYVADALFGAIAYRTAPKVEGDTFMLLGLLAGGTGLISAGLGLVASAVLYVALE